MDKFTEELVYINLQKKVIDYEESKINENVEACVHILFSKDKKLSFSWECRYREAVRRIYEKSVAKKRKALRKLEKDLEDLDKRLNFNLYYIYGG